MRTINLAWLMTAMLLLLIAGSCGAEHGKAIRRESPKRP